VLTLRSNPVQKLAFAKALLEEEGTYLKLGSLEACRREAGLHEATGAHHVKGHNHITLIVTNMLLAWKAQRAHRVQGA